MKVAGKFRQVALRLGAILTLCAGVSTAQADDSAQLLRIDHYLKVRSTAPAMAGQDAQLYLREVVLAGSALRPGASRGVVLFVHGAGTPTEVSFDVPYKDYSWMAYLAQAGYDVFSLDLTGYGRSTRPAPMNDACNFSAAAQAQFVPTLIRAPCPASYRRPITTMSSDWDDIDAAVDHLRRLRGVQTVSMVAWSQGGPRAGGYAARNPEKVSRLVVLAPAYRRESSTAAPATLPASDGPMTAQSLADFTANWDRQVGCPGQFGPEAATSVWSELLASDPVGATWGPGVRRAPAVPTWGFNAEVVRRMRTPFLMIAAAHDKQVEPQLVRDLYADLGSEQKVLVELACASHNAMWESNHLVLFKASLDWLRDGKIAGQSQGVVQLGQ